MFKKYLKPKIVPYLGEIVDAFFTSLPFLGMYSALTMTIVLYTSISEWLLVWFPWMNFGIFICLMFAALLIVLVTAHKYIIPSIWHARSKKMTHLEKKLDLIIEGMGKKENVGKEVRVAVSGGFDPIHPGHLDYIEEALKLGTYLLIILTRDEQLIEKDRMADKKKNRLPIPYDVRKATLEWGLGDRGKVLMNIDKDITSCKSIRRYHPDIFAKGGDSWDVENLPEKSVCDELGIEIVFGVGGYDKPYSSSSLGVGGNDEVSDNIC